MLFVAPHLGGATARPTALIMIDQGLQHEWRYEEERDDMTYGEYWIITRQNSSFCDFEHWPFDPKI